MKIKKIRLSSIGDVVPLFNNYMVFYEQPSNTELYRSYLKERIKNNEATIFVAYSAEGKAVGFVLIYQCFSSVSLGKIIILNDLYVLPEGRKLGIGKQLILKTIDFAKKMNAVRVDLGTSKDNFKAQRLYETIGFVKDDAFYSYSFGLKK